MTDSLAELTRQRDEARALIRKLDAGIARISIALGFTPGGLDTHHMAFKIEQLRTERDTLLARVAELEGP